MPENMPVSTPGSPSPSGTSRTPWMLLGACCVLLLLLSVLAGVIGVVLWRDRAGGGAAPGPTTPAVELATHSHEVFSLEHPAGWIVDAPDPAPSSSGLYVTVRDAEPADEFSSAPRELAVFKGSLPGVHALVTCEMESARMGFGFDEQSDPSELPSRTVDGIELVGWEITGTADGQDAVEQLYCGDVGDDVLMFHLRTVGTTAMDPEVEAILDSVDVAD